MTVRSSIRGAIRSSIRASIGKIGNLFNGIYAFYPLATNGDNTIVPTTEINTRLSPKNYDNDSGNLVTVGEYETAFTGSAALYEPSATNNVPNPELRSSDNVSPNFWVHFNQGIVSVSDEGAYSVTMIETNNQRDFFSYPSAPTTSGVFYTFSVYIDVIEGVNTLFRYCSINTPLGSPTSLIYKVNGVAQSSSYVLPVGVNFIEIVMEASVTASVEPRFGLGGTGNTTGKSKFYLLQFEEGQYATSRILSDINAPTTRDSDKPTVPSSDAWVDGGVTLGTNTIGTKLNGVDTATNSLDFRGDSGGATNAGKYYGKVVEEWDGAILTAKNGASMTVVLRSGLSTFIYSKLTNSKTGLLTTDAEIQAGFENTGDSSNFFTIAFQHSDYDLAGIKQLRNDVGDYGENANIVTTNTSLSPTADVNGNIITLDGAYGAYEVLVQIDWPSQGDVGGTKLVSVVNVTGTTPPTGLYYLSTQLVQGMQTIVTDLPPSLPTPFSAGLIADHGGDSGTLDCVVEIVSSEFYRWLDFPTTNFTTSFKFTPLALTGAGDSIVNVVDTANSQGYFVSIPDSNYDSFEVTVYEGANTMLVTVPIAGGININQEYSCIVSITDSDVYLSIDESTVSDTNTVTFAAGNWDAKIPLAGSSEAAYTCKIADLKCEDYVQPPTGGSELPAELPMEL